MTRTLVPQKEFILRSHCTRAEIVDALSDELVETAEWRMFGSNYHSSAPEKAQYEGQVNDLGFSITHYGMVVQPREIWMSGSTIPQIDGTFKDTENGVEIKVTFRPASSPWYQLLNYAAVPILIPVLIASGDMEIVYFALAMIPVMIFIGVVRSVDYYKRSVDSDIERLRTIFKAQE